MFNPYSRNEHKGEDSGGPALFHISLNDSRIGNFAKEPVGIGKLDPDGLIFTDDARLFQSRIFP